MRPMRRTLNEAIVSASALLLLLATLVAVDPRVRDQLSLRVGGGGASSEIARAGSEIRNVATVLVQAARDQSLEHAPLMIFALGATVLVLFMLRT